METIKDIKVKDFLGSGKRYSDIFHSLGLQDFTKFKEYKQKSVHFLEKCPDCTIHDLANYLLNNQISFEQKSKENYDTLVSQVLELRNEQLLSWEEIAAITKVTKYRAYSIYKNHFGSKDAPPMGSRVKELYDQVCFMREVNEFSFEKIATLLDLTKQRVHQIYHYDKPVKNTRYITSDIDIDLLISLLKEGLSYVEIAKKLDKNPESIRSFCSAHNLNQYYQRKENLQQAKEEFIETIEKLILKGLSYEEIGKKLNRHPDTIGKYVRRYKLNSYYKAHIETKPEKPVKTKTKKISDKTKIKNLDQYNQIKDLILEGLTYREIAEKLNKTYDYIKKYCFKNKLNQYYQHGYKKSKK